MTPKVLPRRSVIYIPGSSERAIAKVPTLEMDAIILDLEDAVAPDEKARARNAVLRALRELPNVQGCEIAIRVNALGTPWFSDDLSTVSQAMPHAIVLPKVESAKNVDAALSKLPGNCEVPIWCMIETPRGVLRCLEIADHERVTCLVLGTSDLSKELRAQHTLDREPMLTALSTCVMAARAAGIAVIDGVHLDLSDETGFLASCRQGRDLGFDGKTLIHPKQISASNSIFSPSEEDVIWSKKIIRAFEVSKAAGRGVAVVDGKLIENLHIDEAERIIALDKCIRERRRPNLRD